jgi:methionine-rich copper-binding protein CopC
MPFHRRMETTLFAFVIAVASVGVSAHAILIDSSPKPNGSVPAGHTALTLKYNSKIDQGRSRLVLVAPDHSETALPIATQADKPNELDSQADLKPGAYVIHWQALALDGHITRGDLSFNVTTAQP